MVTIDGIKTIIEIFKIISLLALICELSNISDGINALTENMIDIFLDGGEEAEELEEEEEFE